MPIDVTAARAATPGCQDLIHLNNAGAALPTHDVLTTQIDYLQLEARIGGYEAYTHEQARIEQIRPTIARLIGADPSGDEVASRQQHGGLRSLSLLVGDLTDRALTLVIASSRPKPSTARISSPTSSSPGGSASRSRSFPPMTTEKSISTHLRPASDEPTSARHADRANHIPTTAA